MSSPSKKLEILIDVVYEKTVEGQLRWDRGYIGRNFTVRFDDYILQIEASLTNSKPTFTIKKISGSIVAQISRATNALLPGSRTVSDDGFRKIDMLLDYLDSYDADIDDLLNKLR